MYKRQLVLEVPMAARIRRGHDDDDDDDDNVITLACFPEI